MRRILSEALDAAAAELADLASAAQNLQLALEGDSEGAPPQAFGPAPSDSLRAPLEPGKQRKVVALQSLDYLTQSLQCLAGFIALAAAEIPPECDFEPERLLRTVWLSRLRSHLAGVPEESAPEGECELFDPA